MILKTSRKEKSCFSNPVFLWMIPKQLAFTMLVTIVTTTIIIFDKSSFKTNCIFSSQEVWNNDWISFFIVQSKVFPQTPQAKSITFHPEREHVTVKGFCEPAVPPWPSQFGFRWQGSGQKADSDWCPAPLWRRSCSSGEGRANTHGRDHAYKTHLLRLQPFPHRLHHTHSLAVRYTDSGDSPDSKNRKQAT